jgi:hypothetical protein
MTQHNGAGPDRREADVPEADDLNGSQDAATPLEQRMNQIYEELWNQFVDPREAFFDGDGRPWDHVATAGGAMHRTATPYATEAELARIRARCRRLAIRNEFAINGHENRISFIVGRGHRYQANAREGRPAGAELVRQVQEVLDEFLFRNRWHHRQQEIVRRRDRDGEVFLRLFFASDGTVQLRFVEPDQVATPGGIRTDAAASFGVLTEPDDVETVRGYYIDGQLVPPREIQHRKANVDSNVKRGLPLFFPVFENLERAEKLLRNMSVVAGVQSAIALIRKHRDSGAATVRQFRGDTADLTTSAMSSGKARYFQQFQPGTIIDAHGGVEYDFPSQQVNAAAFVPLLQAELRAIASRLVMPEFMLTSDASNANYASTLVAEGPAIRMFERMQHDQIVDDRELLGRVLEHAHQREILPASALTDVMIQIVPPTLAIRDELKETQRRRIEFNHGILSAQTWTQLAGYDYAQEQTNIGAHQSDVRAHQSEVGTQHTAGGRNVD